MCGTNRSARRRVAHAAEVAEELDALREIFGTDELEIVGTRRIKLRAVARAFTAAQQRRSANWMAAKAARDFGASGDALGDVLEGERTAVHVSIVLTAQYPHSAPLIQVEGRGIARFTVSAKGLESALIARAGELVGEPSIFSILALAQEHVVDVTEAMVAGTYHSKVVDPRLTELYDAWRVVYRAQNAALLASLRDRVCVFGTDAVTQPVVVSAASAVPAAPPPPPPPVTLLKNLAAGAPPGRRAKRSGDRGQSTSAAELAALAAVPPSLLEPQALVGSLHDLFDRIPEQLGVVSIENVVNLQRAAHFVQRRALLAARRDAAPSYRGASRVAASPVQLHRCLPAEALFHGTRRQHVASIVRNGLVVPVGERALSLGVGIDNGAAFGNGIYTSPSAVFSLDYCDTSSWHFGSRMRGGSRKRLNTLLVCATNRDECREATQSICVFPREEDVLPVLVIHCCWLDEEHGGRAPAIRRNLPGGQDTAFIRRTKAGTFVRTTQRVEREIEAAEASRQGMAAVMRDSRHEAAVARASFFFGDGARVLDCASNYADDDDDDEVDLTAVLLRAQKSRFGGARGKKKMAFTDSEGRELGYTDAESVLEGCAATGDFQVERKGGTSAPKPEPWGGGAALGVGITARRKAFKNYAKRTADDMQRIRLREISKPSGTAFQVYAKANETANVKARTVAAKAAKVKMTQLAKGTTPSTATRNKIKKKKKKKKKKAAAAFTAFMLDPAAVRAGSAKPREVLRRDPASVRAAAKAARESMLARCGRGGGGASSSGGAIRSKPAAPTLSEYELKVAAEDAARRAARLRRK